MLALGLRTLRTRAGSFVGTFVMIAITATVVAAAGQLMATALGAPGAGRFAAADAIVRADPNVRIGFGDNAETVEVQRAALLPEAAVARAAAVPGVRRAVGDISFPLTVLGRDKMPLPTAGSSAAHAHGWPSAALTPYRLAAGAPPAVGEVVLDAGLAGAGRIGVGDRVRVVAPGGAQALRVSGIARASTAQQERQSAVFVEQEQAQRMAASGPGVDAIAVQTDPGVDGGELRASLRDAVAAVPGVRGEPQALDHRHATKGDAGDPRAVERVTLVAVLASGGGITTGISVFVVAGAIAFVVGRRRREIALLRAVGATPGQVRRMLLWETALVGLLAGITGCLLAAALSSRFTDALIDVGLAPDGFAVSPHWIPYAIAVATATVVALLASLLAVRQALRVLPGEALVAAAVPQRRMGVVRWLVGLTALGGGVTLVIVLSFGALSFASLAASCFAIGLALLGPVLLGHPAALAGRLVRDLGGGAGFLAGSALATGRFRTGAVAAAIALIVALGGAQVVSLATARDAAERETAQRVTADRVLVARDGDGLPPSVAADAARLPGVRAAAGMVSTEVYLLDRDLTHDGDSWNAVGLDPAAARGALDLGVRAGSLDAVRGDGIAISTTVADDGGVRLGQVLRAQLADATPARLRVVAIYDRPNGMGDVVLPRSLALAHATAPLDAAVFVSGDGPQATRELDALARAVATVALQSRAGYLDGVDAQQQEAAETQWVIAALMLLVAAMAAFNTGAIAAAERRPELLLARLAGATRRQVAGALTIEAAVTTFVGLAAGAAVALASLARVGDDPNGGPLVIPLGQAALVLAVGAALGLLGTLVPAALTRGARLTALAGLRE